MTLGCRFLSIPKNIVAEARNVGRGQEKAGKNAIWPERWRFAVSVTLVRGSLITRDFDFGKKLVERRHKIAEPVDSKANRVLDTRSRKGFKTIGCQWAVRFAPLVVEDRSWVGCSERLADIP
jgi:hypothetical protein